MPVVVRFDPALLARVDAWPDGLTRHAKIVGLIEAGLGGTPVVGRSSRGAEPAALESDADLRVRIVPPMKAQIEASRTVQFGPTKRKPGEGLKGK